MTTEAKRAAKRAWYHRNREKVLLAQREEYHAQKADAVGLHGHRGLAAAILAQAVKDCTGRWDIDGAPMRENIRAEAGDWLSTTGREWAEMLGVDARLVDRVTEGI